MLKKCTHFILTYCWIFCWSYKPQPQWTRLGPMDWPKATHIPEQNILSSLTSISTNVIFTIHTTPHPIQPLNNFHRCLTDMSLLSIASSLLVFPLVKNYVIHFIKHSIRAKKLLWSVMPCVFINNNAQVQTIKVDNLKH